MTLPSWITQDVFNELAEFYLLKFKFYYYTLDMIKFYSGELNNQIKYVIIGYNIYHRHMLILKHTKRLMPEGGGGALHQIFG